MGYLMGLMVILFFAYIYTMAKKNSETVKEINKMHSFIIKDMSEEEAKEWLDKYRRYK